MGGGERLDASAPGASGAIERVALAGASPGTERHLLVVRYGDPGARPKAYLQAAVHADETPGLLVLERLRANLDAAAAAGEVCGHVVVVPAANPIGLAQVVNGRLLGRHALAGAGNFNRSYPDLRATLVERVGGGLGADAAANVASIRAGMGAALDELAPVEETEALRLTLMRLAYDADIVLDLHCDEEALLHVYLGTALWPDASDLPRWLGARAVLVAADSGGSPFDEALAGPWWGLAERFPAAAVPPACLAATVELRGETDVSGRLAEDDADRIVRFLRGRGVLAGDPGPTPSLACEATALEAVDLVRAPRAGVIDFDVGPGDRVDAGQRVATLVDPLAEDRSSARFEVHTAASGIVFARSSARMARPGTVLCKVAGTQPLAWRASGDLLTD